MEQSLVAWEDGWRVRLPLPFELKWIHAYLLPGTHGYTILDCGLNYDKAWETWRAVFQQLNIQVRDIKRIVLTHYHPDHYGLAGRLQQLTGARVWMSALTEQQAQLFWGPDDRQLEQIAEFYHGHGLPEITSGKLVANLQHFRGWVSPHPAKPRLLAAGDTCQLGERIYEVWHTPGHSEDHLSFYDPEREWLIGGDILLRRITPNISLYPNGDLNPLDTFFTTLRKLEQKPIQKVLPAHGPVFTDVQERIHEILAHHETRLQQIERLADGSQTAFEMCLALFGNNLSIHNLRFALAETLAHLEYLRLGGRLALEEKGNTRCYRRI